MLMTVLVIATATFAFLALVTSRPDSFRVQRTTSIRAEPAAIFALIEDFRRWTEWSPFETLDPAMLRTYGGAAKGQGAVYQWAGDNKAGAGRMEILEAAAPARLVIKLDFLRPFAAHNTAEFTLEPKGRTTEVTWAMHGPSPFLAKLTGLVFSMDRMVGKSFETGLANLKAATEK